MRKSYLRKIIWIVIIGIFVVSISPNIFSDYWLVDIFSNFKLQYLFISIVLLIISGLLLRKKKPAFMLLVVSIVWNGYYIVPYYLKPEVVTHESDFKIASINLLSGNTKIGLVKKYIIKENPDILILMEFNPKWQRDLLSIMEKYPYKELVPRTDNFGIALLSEFKMKSSVNYFGLHSAPSIRGDIVIENENFSIVATHPVPPINQASFENRNLQLKNIIAKRTTFSDNLIVVGDFNTSSFSNHFSGLLQGDLKDSRMGFGLLSTWPADFGVLQTTLDHCLVSTNLDVVDRSTGENIGSDHLPITLVIGVN